MIAATPRPFRRQRCPQCRGSGHCLVSQVRWTAQSQRVMVVIACPTCGGKGQFEVPRLPSGPPTAPEAP